MYRFLSHGFMRPDIQPISDTATHVRVSPYVHVYTHASRRSCYAVLLPKWAEISPLTMENGLYSPSLSSCSGEKARKGAHLSVEAQSLAKPTWERRKSQL